MENHNTVGCSVETPAENADKKAWVTPEMEKLDVMVHTQNVLGSNGSDGPNYQS